MFRNLHLPRVIFEVFQFVFMAFFFIFGACLAIAIFMHIDQENYWSAFFIFLASMLSLVFSRCISVLERP